MFDENSINAIQKILGYEFRNKALLVTAFTHSSFANEHRAESNEKLEYLGDSVLNFLIADYLYGINAADEGYMSKFRAGIVSRRPLANIISKMGLMGYLRMGVGASRENKISDKFVSNLYEAIVAAIYLDGGMDAAKTFVYSTLLRTAFDRNENCDFKTILQEKLQAVGLTDIVYHTTSDKDANGEFCSTVFINSQPYGSGVGGRKKSAEQSAARATLCMLNKQQND